MQQHMQVRPSCSVRRLFIVTVALGLVAAACSPGGGTSAPTSATSTGDTANPASPSSTSQSSSSDRPTTAGSPISPERRAEILDEVLGFVGSLPRDDPEADHERLAHYLADRPEFIDAGVSEDGTVWGVFTDGRLYAHVDNRYERPDGTAAPAPGATATRTDRVVEALPAVFRAAAGAELPISTQASIVNGLSAAYGEPAGSIGPWLQGAGYSVAGSDATIERLKDVSGDGVFYYTGHGGVVTPHLGPDAGKKVYLLVSTTPISPENSVTYAEDLEAGRVVYASAPIGDNPDYRPSDPDCKDPTKRARLQKCWPELWKGFYGISERFIQTYWNFPDHALVVLDACTSNDLASTVLGLGNPGAFAGWSGEVTPSGSGMILDLFFDRLLGENTVPPDEDPDVRPFDAGTVGEYLRHVGKVEDPKTPGTKLVVTQNSPTILVPSIATMEMQEKTGELFIDGLFGTKNDTVTVGRTRVSTTNWGPDEVVVKLPVDGPGSAGTVQVAVDGRRSNEVPLTEWRGKVNYEASFDGLAKGLMSEVHMNLHFRADVHLARTVPWEDPKPRTVFLEAAEDSDAPWEMSGTGTRAGTKFTISGSGVLASEATEPNHDKAMFLVTGKLVAEDPHTPPRIEDVLFHMHLSSLPDTESSLEIKSATGTVSSGMPIPVSPILEHRTFELDEEFNIKDGKVEGDAIGIPGLARLFWDTLHVTRDTAPSLSHPPPA